MALSIGVVLGTMMTHYFQAFYEMLEKSAKHIVNYGLHPAN
jgi:hypothetical protein